MKIKSRVWHWLAVACGSVGLLYGMGLEGNTQIDSPVSSAQFTTAFILVLLSLLFLKLGFIAQEREEREAKRRRYGKINRNHARNPEYPEYPEHQERGA
jgi:drug/metabolite transporter (DMT)-like permease